MNKKKWIGPILFILMVIVCGQVFGSKIIFWSMSIRWHLVNKDILTFHNVTRKLPLRWWIIDQNEKRIIFAAVPFNLGDDYPMFSLSKSSMTEEEFKKMYDLKTIQDQSVEFVSSKTATIGEENAFGVRHINKKDKKIFEHWTIPAQGFTVTILDLPEEWYAFVWDFISSDEWSFK